MYHSFHRAFGIRITLKPVHSLHICSFRISPSVCGEPEQQEPWDWAKDDECGESLLFRLCKFSSRSAQACRKSQQSDSYPCITGRQLYPAAFCLMSFGIADNVKPPTFRIVFVQIHTAVHFPSMLLATTITQREGDNVLLFCRLLCSWQALEQSRDLTRFKCLDAFFLCFFFSPPPCSWQTSSAAVTSRSNMWLNNITSHFSVGILSNLSVRVAQHTCYLLCLCRGVQFKL